MPLLLLFVTVVSLSLSIALAHAQSLTITQCSSGDSSCQQSTTTATPRAGSSHPHRSSSGSSTGSSGSGSNEVHTYSLRNGQGQVQSPNGSHHKDNLTLNVSPSVQHALHPRHHSTPPSVAAPSAPPKPPVSTSGGGGLVSSFTAPLSTLTGDQALAQFAVPPFLMPIYIAAGRTYGVPWNVLASINQIETDFGRNLNISSAGAEGWMQFMPATWKTWGVDASGDGYADPYNPVDAIYAAARYLQASGAGQSLSKAILSYNHASWYVAEVLKTAGIYGSLPPGLVGTTTTLAYGRFPLLGKASYGDDFAAAQAAHRKPAGLTIHGADGATAIATQEVKVTRILLDPTLAGDLRRGGLLAGVSGHLAAPSPAATPTVSPVQAISLAARVAAFFVGGPKLAAAVPALRPTAARPAAVQRRAAPNGLPAGYGVSHTPGITVVVRDGAGDSYSYGGLSQLRPTIRPGVTLNQAQPIGSLPSGNSATLNFAVQTSGGAPVDPRPLVDGYRLQEATNLYHAIAPFGRNPFVPSGPASTPGHRYVFPLPSGVHWTPGRVDMGWDIETGTAGVGQPLVAIGDAKILHIQSMGAFGPTWISYQLLDGPAAGKTIFIGHSGPPLVQPGDTVRAGQPIIKIHGGSYGGPPGHFEIGWANADGSNTLAAPHYHEGDRTQEGASFQSFVAQLPGALTDAAFPAGPSALKPQKVSNAQELKLSRALDKITDPHVRQKPSPSAVRVGRSRQATPPATGALTLLPSVAGAKITAVASAPSGHSGEAWAIGTVDGDARPGWAPSQVVLLHYHQGSWALAGPPRDAQGQIANSTLRALAVAADGRGYAVGDHGALVSFGSGAPRLLDSGTSVPLAAVAARSSRTGLAGIAVGARGTVIRLAGTRVTRERPVAGRPDLRAVTLGAGGALIAGSPSQSGQSVYRDDGTSTRALNENLGLPHGTGIALDSIAQGGGELWVAGAIGDGSTTAGERPFAARRDAHGWRTFCASGAAAAGVVELGRPTATICDAGLAGGAAQGFATSVAVTRAGALLATPSGIELLQGNNFRLLQRSLPTSGASLSHLSVDASGDGWALGANRLGRIAPGGRSSGTTPLRYVVRSAAPGAKTPAAVAVSPDGGRALAITGQRAAALAGGASGTLAGPGVPVRAAAIAGSGHGWAIADSGQLLAENGGKWSLPGERSGLAGLLGARQSLGPAALSGTTGSAAPGFAALAFRSSSEGYAVGSHGLIDRYDGSKWVAENAPTSADLSSVAAGSAGVVAVGSAGTLLERDGGEWHLVGDAGKLVAGQDFTAAASLADGTLLAAAGGEVIQGTGAGSWQRAPIAPLGVGVLKLAGYRDGSGALHALVLTAGADGLALLDGDGTGWRPVASPAGFVLSDFAVDETTRKLWLAGSDGQGTGTIELNLPADGGGDPPPPASPSNLLRSLGL